MRSTSLIKRIALAALVVTAASCGGSDDSNSRQRNSAIAEPTITRAVVGFAPEKIVIDADGNAYVMSTQSTKIPKITPNGDVLPWGDLDIDPVDIDIDENGNVYALTTSDDTTVLTKFRKDGLVDYTLIAPTKLDRLAVASSQFAVAALRGANAPVSFDLANGGTVTMIWDEFGDVGKDLVGGSAAIVGVRRDQNDVMVRRLPMGGMQRVQTCPGMTDATVTSSGKVHVVCKQSQLLVVIDDKDEPVTFPLAFGLPYAVDVLNDISYVTSVTAEKVFTIDAQGVTQELFATDKDPLDIAVNASGVVAVANSGSETVTIYTPASSAGGTFEQMPALSAPEFGDVTASAYGFSTPIMNYDNNQMYMATATAGIASIDSTGVVVVTGLSPDETAAVTVTVERPGYSSAESTRAGSSLKAALTYVFGEVIPTVDGFTVPILNYSPVWETKVGLNPDTANAALDPDTGLLTITDLSAGQEATVDVYSIRRGYMNGVSTVTGRAAEATQTPEPTEDDQQTGEPLEEVSGNEVPQTDTSSNTTLNTTATTVSDMTTSTIGAEQTQGVPAVTIAANNTTVAAVPAAAIQDSVPVVVATGTKEIACDDACVDALLAYVGSNSGTVTASVGGGAAVPVAKGKPTVLATGDEDTSIAFTVTADDGTESVVNVPVVQAKDTAGAGAPAETADSGSRSTPWILWVIIVLVVLLILLVLLRRKKSNSAAN